MWLYPDRVGSPMAASQMDAQFQDIDAGHVDAAFIGLALGLDQLGFPERFPVAENLEDNSAQRAWSRVVQRDRGLESIDIFVQPIFSDRVAVLGRVHGKPLGGFNAV